MHDNQRTQTLLADPSFIPITVAARKIGTSARLLHNHPGLKKIRISERITVIRRSDWDRFLEEHTTT